MKEKKPEPRQFVNPVYGTDENVQQDSSNAASASTTTATTAATVTPATTATTAATATTATTTATTADYDTVDLQYSTIGANKTDEHKFDNPIYGDEITSNVYSHTTHNGHPQSDKPMATFDDASYSHVVLPSEAPAADNDPSQGHLYSHTSHQPGLPVPAGTEQPQTSDVAYDVLNLPHYDDPNTLQVLPPPEVDAGARYEVADVEPAPNNSTPLALIYNELEEHTYSTLENK